MAGYDKIHPVEEELQKATKVRPKIDEDRQRYLKRMAKNINDFEPWQWTKLSDQAKRWFNDAAEAINNKLSVPDFDESRAARPRARQATPSVMEAVTWELLDNPYRSTGEIKKRIRERGLVFKDTTLNNSIYAVRQVLQIIQKLKEE